MSGLRSSVPLVPFKRFSEPILGKMLQPQQGRETDIEAPYLKAGHVQWGGIELPDELPQMWVSPSDTQTLHPAVGDLLICEGGEVGRAALVDKKLPPETIIQNSLHLVREGARAYPRYLKYALEYVSATGWLDLICNKATIAHLTVDKLRELPIPFWKKDEQQRIANFLDEQTARIDALIAGKDELLGKLAEYRVAIAEAVVTDAPGRSRVRLGLHVDLLPGYAFPSEKFSSDPDGVPLLRGINVAPGCIRWDETVYWPHTDDATLERFRLKTGDVVFGMDRPWVSAGTRVAMVDEDAEDVLLLQRVCRLRGGEKFHQRFIYYALASDRFRQSVEVDLTGVSVPHISPEQILSFKVPAISFEEQHDRCEEADRRVSSIDELTMHASRVVDRLREYRSSLISAAVTGQIDINNFQMEAA